MTENIQPKQPANEQTAVKRRPNETGSIHVEGFVKIFDPASKEVYVEKRA
jgi:hypothetical protein